LMLAGSVVLYDRRLDIPSLNFPVGEDGFL
jgi:hypothetical protein